MILLILALKTISSQRILTTTANTSLLYYETPPSSFVGCVRIMNDTVIDMAKNDCNGGQCPRCFILTEGTPAVNVVKLTLKNCHADHVYPPTRTDIATTRSKLFEYTFLNFGGQRTTFRIFASDNPDDNQYHDIGLGIHRYLTAYCFDGILYTK